MLCQHVLFYHLNDLFFTTGQPAVYSNSHCVYVLWICCADVLYGYVVWISCVDVLYLPQVNDGSYDSFYETVEKIRGATIFRQRCATCHTHDQQVSCLHSV